MCLHRSQLAENVGELLACHVSRRPCNTTHQVGRSIDHIQIHVEQKESTAFLVMMGRPYGLKAKISLEQLEALAAELTREASIWRRRILPD
jgi:hypothetical protein